MRVLGAGLLAMSVLAGCGGSDGGRPDVRAYEGLAVRISGAASAYATAAGAAADVPACHSAHAAYRAQVGPMVDRMRAMSGDMDREMERMGHGGDADMTCGADAMMAELGHHDAAACASADMPANHAEAERHVSAMEAWADHQHARSQQMGGMMGMSGMGGVDTPGCHRNADGSFTLGP